MAATAFSDPNDSGRRKSSSDYGRRKKQFLSSATDCTVYIRVAEFCE
jgi:hypothetical protein